MNTGENSALHQTPPPAGTFAAQKLPPRLADRISMQDAARAAENLPALKNQLQTAVQMLQQAMEQNLAAERRRLQRTLALFMAVLAGITALGMGGMGWLFYKIQVRLAAAAPLAIAAAAPAAVPVPPAVEPLPVQATPPVNPPPLPQNTATGAVPVVETMPVSNQPLPATEALSNLQADLQIMEEKSRALDNLLATQDSRLQRLMEEIADLDRALSAPPSTVFTNTATVPQRIPLAEETGP